MFDIGASEFLLIVIVAIVVIGPKDMPVALRTAGRWIAKMRRISGHFRSGIETMIREAELEEMERKWREQNEAIMKAHPQVTHEAAPDEIAPEANAPADEPAVPMPGSAESALTQAKTEKERSAEPQLPLPPP